MITYSYYIYIFAFFYLQSQSLTRLAAAHRAAVRALQMFVNQAPLYYDLKHGLPPIYSELGLLIQQLSLLSSHFDASQDLPDFDMDMLPRTKVGIIKGELCSLRFTAFYFVRNEKQKFLTCRNNLRDDKRRLAWRAFYR